MTNDNDYDALADERGPVWANSAFMTDTTSVSYMSDPVPLDTLWENVEVETFIRSRTFEHSEVRWDEKDLAEALLKIDNDEFTEYPDVITQDQLKKLQEALKRRDQRIAAQCKLYMFAGPNAYLVDEAITAMSKICNTHVVTVEVDPESCTEVTNLRDLVNAYKVQELPTYAERAVLSAYKKGAKAIILRGCFLARCKIMLGARKYYFAYGYEEWEKRCHEVGFARVHTWDLSHESENFLSAVGFVVVSESSAGALPSSVVDMPLNFNDAGELIPKVRPCKLKGDIVVVKGQELEQTFVGPERKCLVKYFPLRDDMMDPFVSENFWDSKDNRVYPVTSLGDPRAIRMMNAQYTKPKVMRSWRRESEVSLKDDGSHWYKFWKGVAVKHGNKVRALGASFVPWSRLSGNFLPEPPHKRPVFVCVSVHQYQKTLRFSLKGDIRMSRIRGFKVGGHFPGMIEVAQHAQEFSIKAVYGDGITGDVYDVFLRFDIEFNNGEESSMAYGPITINHPDVVRRGGKRCFEAKAMFLREVLFREKCRICGSVYGTTNGSGYYKQETCAHLRLAQQKY